MATHAIFINIKNIVNNVETYQQYSYCQLKNLKICKCKELILISI